jgi:hypothetical protein
VNEQTVAEKETALRETERQWAIGGSFRATVRKLTPDLETPW